MNDSIDRYRFCERETCDHDLSPGVLVADLLKNDGPFPAVSRFAASLLQGPAPSFAASEAA